MTLMSLQQLIKERLWEVILIGVGCVVFVAILIGLVVLCVRKRRQSDACKANKNTVELNEEEFKEYLELAKGGEAGATINISASKKGEKGEKYLQFNDEDFVDGVPRKTT